MYAAIRKYRIDPKQSQELARRVESGFVPILNGTKGFVAYFVVDAGDGNVASVSVFDDRAGAEESTRRAAEWVKQNVVEFVRGAPEVTAGEVTVHARGGKS
jgi:hypothetical protein